MKKLFVYLIALFFLTFWTGGIDGAMQGEEAHKKYLYPIVRVTTNAAGGSGTIIFSKENDGKNSNYVLTNHHVISDAIKIEEKWDSNLQKNIKVERRALIYVEIFKYKELGTPIGTMKIEADIIIYEEVMDLALLKLRLVEPIPHIANLPKKTAVNAYNLFDETVAVGCSLGSPPIATVGILTRKNFQIDSLAYHMSSSQIIYGNSGGAMFLSDGTFIGIPSKVAVIGWGTPIPHMGLFIPVSRIYEWFEKENYSFLFDDSKKENECLKQREERIEKEKSKK